MKAERGAHHAQHRHRGQDPPWGHHGRQVGEGIRCIPQGAQDERRGHDAEAGQVAERPHQDDRTGGVAHHDNRDQRDRGPVSSGHVEADERSHPGQADDQSHDGLPAERLPTGPRTGHDRAHQGDGGHQQARQRAGEALLGGRQQDPGDREFHRGVDDQRPPPGQDRSQLAAGGGDREQDCGPYPGSAEDQDGRAEVADRDLDEQIGNAPDHAHGGEQEQAATGHDWAILGNGPRRSAPISGSPRWAARAEIGETLTQPHRCRASFESQAAVSIPDHHRAESGNRV